MAFDSPHFDIASSTTWFQLNTGIAVIPRIANHRRVTADYETCLKRIRVRRKAVSNIKAKHNDINRILYMQNKGFNRIFTVLARGYLFHNGDGTLRTDDPYTRIEEARSFVLLCYCKLFIIYNQ